MEKKVLSIRVDKDAFEKLAERSVKDKKTVPCLINEILKKELLEPKEIIKLEMIDELISSHLANLENDISSIRQTLKTEANESFIFRRSMQKITNLLVAFCEITAQDNGSWPSVRKRWEKHNSDQGI